MGDVLSLSVLLDPLRSAFPNAELWVLTKHKNDQVLAIDRRVAHVLTTVFPWSSYSDKGGSFSDWKELTSFLWKNRGDFDLGIDTRGDVRSQIVLLLLRCRIRVGYTNYLGSNLSIRGRLLTHKLEKGRHIHRYGWNRDLLRVVSSKMDTPIDFPVIQLRQQDQSAQQQSIPPILIHIGGGWEFKRWRTEKWAKLAQELNAIRATEVIGGPAEATDLQAIQSRLPVVPCSITPLYIDLVHKVMSCEILVCLDSGPMNLAVLLGKKVVALFGPGDSDMWHPYANGSFIHKRDQYPCNPCFQRKCFYPSVSCMDQIEVREVLSLVKQLVH